MTDHLTGLASDYPAGHHVRTHCHDTHQIVHAIQGVMRVTTEHDVWLVPPGRCLWLPKRVPHSILCRGKVRLRTVYLDGCTTDFPATSFVSALSPLLREIMVRIAEGAPKRQLPHLAALLLDELHSLVKEPISLPRPQSQPIQRLCESWLQAPDSTETLTEWAKQLNLSERTLIRRIKEETGMSFREYRRQVRILTAIERLATEVSITNVALNVGFESHSAFSQAFRHVTGKTPKQFRNDGKHK